MIAPIMPSVDALRPYLDKLEANAGSVVIIAIEWPRDSQNYPVVGTGWFNADARARLKRALKAEKRRVAPPPPEEVYLSPPGSPAGSRSA